MAKFEIASDVYKTIISWYWTKRPKETIEEYIKRIDKYQENKKFMDHHDNINKLKKNELNTYDVTFLHKLLPIICYDKISKTGSRKNKERMRDREKIECHLKFIKEFRNDISHEREKAMDEEQLNKLRKHSIDCLSIAAKFCGVDNKTKQDKISKILADFDKLFEDTATPETRDEVIKSALIIRGRREITKATRRFVPLSDDYRINIDIDKVFYVIDLSYQRNQDEDCMGSRTDLDATEKITFKCSKIFLHMTESVTILSGDAGSGKTTLIRKLFNDILRSTEDHSWKGCFDGVERFKLPLYIECRTEKSVCLAELMRNHFLKQMDGFNDNKVSRTLDILDGIIFLIDGYDEAKDTCKELVAEVARYCHASQKRAFCIISSRVESAKHLMSILSNSSVNFHCLSFEKITDENDQKYFLQKYSNLTKLKLGKSNELVESFIKLRRDVQKIFTTPSMLAMFCRLFKQDRANGVSNAQNVHEVYAALFESCQKKMENLIQEHNWAVRVTPSSIAKKIMSKLCSYSLKLWRQQEFTFSKEERDDLVDECATDYCSEDIDFQQILSCILSPEESLLHTEPESFQFPHLTIQEFCAANHIVADLCKPDRLNGNRVSSLKDVIGWEARTSSDKIRFASLFSI